MQFCTRIHTDTHSAFACTDVRADTHTHLLCIFLLEISIFGAVSISIGILYSKAKGRRFDFRQFLHDFCTDFGKLFANPIEREKLFP